VSEPAPLLTTKLFVPRPPAQRVKRERLIKRLEVARPLTLISAPPGFGKTTLPSEWISAGRLRAAWLSLDKADKNKSR
jgi:LuxR family maltose regulon positive regulatory protein